MLFCTPMVLSNASGGDFAAGSRSQKQSLFFKLHTVCDLVCVPVSVDFEGVW